MVHQVSIVIYLCPYKIELCSYSLFPFLKMCTFCLHAIACQKLLFLIYFFQFINFFVCLCTYLVVTQEYRKRAMLVLSRLQFYYYPVCFLNHEYFLH